MPSTRLRRALAHTSQPAIPGLLTPDPAPGTPAYAEHLARQREDARADLARAAAPRKGRSRPAPPPYEAPQPSKGERIAPLVPTPWPDFPCLAVARCEGEVAWVAPEGTDARAAFPLFPGEYRRSPLTPQLYRYGLPHDLKQDLQGHLRAIAARWEQVPDELRKEGDRLLRLLESALCYDESEGEG